jgi:hypothetical protein
MRTRIRLLLAAVLLGAMLPVLSAAPAHAGTLHGHRSYTPAMAWRAADGATITVYLTYVTEEFPEGCRGGVLVSGARNGEPWPLNYWMGGQHLSAPNGTTLRSWGGNFYRNGNGFLSTPVADGLYQSYRRDMYSWPTFVAAKGGSESVWHYHAGQSNVATIDC